MSSHGCLIAGGILFVLAVVELFRNWGLKEELTTATKQAAEIAKTSNSSTEQLEKHAGVDFKGQWEALAALSTALKDLDKSTRFFVLSLAFIGIAGGIVGLDAVATGIAST